MTHLICPTAEAMGRAAARSGAESIRQAIAARGAARIIVATGTSQFQTLEALTREPGIDWSRVTAFHLDEYIGLPITHPASFRAYLKERFVDRVHPAQFHYVQGDAPDPATECERLGRLIREAPVDVAFVGIGENAHLAFNDPPADFRTQQPYLIVTLDEACRRQQLGEGWFANLDAVPTHAISMSIHRILLSRQIVCSVPDQRKARAVRDALEGPITPEVPASKLQEHPHTTVYLDGPAASLLSNPVSAA